MLNNGVTDRSSQFRLPIFICGGQNDFDGRIVVIRKSDENNKIWEGEKLSKDKAKKISGIDNIYWVEHFKDILHKVSMECNRFYFNKNEHYRAKIVVETREDRFIKWAEKEYPSHAVSRSNPILQRIRTVKYNEEINRIQPD